MKQPIRTCVIGALAFVASQLLLTPLSNNHIGWFLNSGTGILLTLAVVVSVAILVEALDRSLSPWRPCWLTAGITIAFVGYLFAIGPGNLFPIVIVMGLTILIPTALIAGYFGMIIAAFARH
jgi:hypothetical protein